LGGYNGKSDINGLNQSTDKLRTIRLGATYDQSDDWHGLNLLDIEYAKGLSMLGASQRADIGLSTQDANPQFGKFSLYLARLQSI
ncbi:hypothetical protein ABTL52_20275, partial [Acinetobacter baumannii]